MAHKSKEFDNLLKEAKDKGFRIVDEGVKVVLYPLDKTKKIYLAHRGSAGYHPLRRYLKSFN